MAIRTSQRCRPWLFGPICLWGYSLGGGVALEVAAHDPAVAAAVLLCPIVDGLAFTLAGDRHNNVRVAAAATAALLRRQHLRPPHGHRERARGSGSRRA